MPNHADDASQWAAADDMVDHFVKMLRDSPTATSQCAMGLLALEHPQRLILLSMIAATALQRLADRDD
jgi:hypothetical protein